MTTGNQRGKALTEHTLAARALLPASFTADITQSHIRVLLFQYISHERIVAAADSTYLETMLLTTEGAVRHFHRTIGNEWHSKVVDV